MSGNESSGRYREECPTCEVRDFVGEGVLIPVWENPSDYDQGKNPDYLGCTECHTMEPYGEAES